jgi:hypothetical protein
MVGVMEANTADSTETRDSQARRNRPKREFDKILFTVFIPTATPAVALLWHS